MTHKIKNINEWEVLTPSGFRDFTGIKKVTKPYTISIVTETNKTLICSGGHQLLIKRNNEIHFTFADTIEPYNDFILNDKNIYEQIVFVEKNEIESDLYDLVNVDNGYEYYANGLLSHNCAHVEGIEELWLALQPSLSTGGSAILISTPKGVGNLFHSLWVKALKGENGFLPVELPWTVQPERDQAWYEQQCAELGTDRAVQQELLCSFLGSGDTFLTNSAMDLIQTSIRKPSFKHSLHDDLYIWEKPIEGHKYIIAADVASGAGKDYSTFHILDITSDTQVAEFQNNKISVDEFSDLLIKIGIEYNVALLCPEQNSYGLIVASNLKKAEYPNLFYEKFRNIFSAYMSQEIRPQDLPGIVTGPKNRDDMLAKMETVLKNGQLRINSERLLEEFKTFVWKGNRAEAMKGYNDDLIMALAVGISLFETSNQSKYSEEEFNKALLSSIVRNNSSLTMDQSGYGKTNSQNTVNIYTNEFFEAMKKQQNDTLQRDAFNGLRNGQAAPRVTQQNPFAEDWSWILK